MIMHVSVTKGVIVISFTINFYCKMINVTSDKESSLCLLKISRNFGRPSFLLPASILNLFTEEFHSCETTLFEFIKVLKTPTVKKRAKMINNFNFYKIDTLSQYDIFILIIFMGLGDFTIILLTGIAH